MSDMSPLNESLTALSNFFVGERTLDETLLRVAQLSVEGVRPADFAGLTLLVNGRQRTAVFTDPTSPEVDQAQYDSGEGPCIHAFETKQITPISSTREDGPWPAFRQAALARGLLSTLSVPMVVNDAGFGAMNLYSFTEHAFSDEDRELALMFASHAAIALANVLAFWDARDVGDRLTQSMASRAVIEQAKGILMGAQHCGSEEAFELLVRTAQRDNVKLRDAARTIVDDVIAGGADQGGARPGEGPPNTAGVDQDRSR